MTVQDIIDAVPSGCALDQIEMFFKQSNFYICIERALFEVSLDKDVCFIVELEPSDTGSSAE